MTEVKDKFNIAGGIPPWILPAALLAGFVLLAGLVGALVLVTSARYASGDGSLPAPTCCAAAGAGTLPVPLAPPCDPKNPAGCFAPLPCFVWVLPVLLGFLLVLGLLFLLAVLLLAFLWKPSYGSWGQLLAFVKLFFQWTVNLPALVKALRDSAAALDTAARLASAPDGIAQLLRNSATNVESAGTKINEIRIPSLKWNTHSIANSPFYNVEFHADWPDAPFGQVQTALNSGRDNLQNAGDTTEKLARALSDTAKGLNAAADVIDGIL